MSSKVKVADNISYPGTAERERMEKALQGREEMYLDLLENANDLIQSVNPDGRFLYVNRVWRETLGYTREEISRLSLFDIIHPDSRAHCMEVFQSVISGGSVDRVEATFVTKDGRKVIVEGSANCKFEDGKPVATRGIFRNITERKQMEEALHESKKRYLDLVNLLPQTIFELDERGNLTFANNQGTLAFGYTLEDIQKGLNALELFIPEDRDRVKKNVQRILSGEQESGANEYTAVRKDGSTFPVISYSSVVVRENKPVGLRGMLVDITERKRMEHDLGERVKELQCLYAIVSIAAKPEVTLDALYQQVVNMLPASWQYPEVTCARIVVNGREFTTENCGDTEWKQSSDIKVHGAKEGEVEVSYLDERPEMDEGPFLKEERLLIDAVATHLGDITERKRMEEALQQSEETLRTYLESAPDGVYINDLKGKFYYGNKKAEEIIGYERGELVGKSFLKLNLLPKKHLAKAGKLLALNAMGRPTGPDQFELTRKDGGRIWTEINTAPIKQAGKVAVIGFVRDITERKRAEEKVRESRRRFIELADLLPQSVWEMDNKGNLTFVNRQGFQSLGYTREDFAQGSSPPQAIAPQDQARVQEQLQRVWNGEQVGGIEYTSVRKDGSTLPMVTFASPIIRENETVGLRGVTVDITERKRTEEALEQSEKKYRELADLLPQSIFEVDESGNITFVNRQAFQTFGYTLKDADEGWKPLQEVVPEDRDRVLEQLQRVWSGEELGGIEYTALRKDGSTFPVVTFASPIIRENRIVGLRGLTVDITERKQMEIELQERNEQLDAQNEELQSQAEELITRQQELMEKTGEVEKANRLKSEFLANMSHELRTPLNVIIGFSELMKDEVPGKVNEEQRQCLSDILDSSQRLLNLINDVLDLSKVESGKMELKRENVVLTEVTESLTRAMMPILTPRKQSLDIEIEEGLPPVYVNASKLLQVLLNLVDNSSRFTPDGGKLKIEAVREGDWCQVSVIDDGIGIKNDDQERIFEPFCQVGNPLTREKTGTGLGLPLVRQIVQRYGGRIWVESEYGQGSRFIFTLPLARSG